MRSFDVFIEGRKFKVIPSRLAILKYDLLVTNEPVNSEHSYTYFIGGSPGLPTLTVFTLVIATDVIYEMTLILL